MDEFYLPGESVVTWADGTPWEDGLECPSPEPVDFNWFYASLTAEEVQAFPSSINKGKSPKKLKFKAGNLGEGSFRVFVRAFYKGSGSSAGYAEVEFVVIILGQQPPQAVLVVPISARQQPTTNN